MSNYWYKNAIIYSLDVETFKDSDDDGIGDFAGLKNALTYLGGLGVTCIWLLPFYDSPNEDNGYDVRNYYDVDPRLGDLGDFVELIEAADELGIRIIIDLPVNHTSKEHQWFQTARRDKTSKYHDFYIWEGDKPEDKTRNVMSEVDEDGSNWEYDEVADAYYYHTFYNHQPDLNISNREVQKEIFRIMQFWLKLGVSGFRIDAAPYMFSEKGKLRFKEDPHDVFREFRDFVEEKRRDAVLLAEVDLTPDQYKKFFGDEDQMHMLFNFYLNNYIYLAFAREEATPIIEAMKKLPRLEKKEQFAIFLRNHDELNLGQLTEEERQEVFEVYAPEKSMRIFGRGIRRRLASMLDNDRRKIELAHSLLLTLPGTPVIWYGQEIGMGEDLSIPGRSSVRTIMQWSNVKNGGFSNAEPEQLFTNVISGGDYGYERVNVNDQQRDPGSLLNWMMRAISGRKEFPEFGWGDCKVMESGNKHMLILHRTSSKGTGISVHNFSDREVTIELTFDNPEEIQEIFGNKKYDDFDPQTQKISLSPYGYRWFHRRKIYL